ncbi:Hydrogen cyanide synthase subunit HcnC [Candidatus Thermoflexus japonica]|uniref:Hydrogen cyanide synthase subunit HcnC n=1 Tax=Candidatus Thermoflexus japonica TaxID=2035417 RepID=A0A2H5Y9S6_9CHLR|nr:Hydrogen cyanide synthase subunit HcnC [Candidatus Thermoflexus japonica]
MILPATADVVIVGGGVMGLSTAYHLLKKSPGLRVVVLEKGPFFGCGSTSKAAGGFRHQFATEVNIRLSLLSIAMMERFAEDPGAPLAMHFCGYLFLLTREEDVAEFRAQVALQHRLGVPTEWLDREEIRRRLPMMRLEDVIAGTFCPRDGLLSPMDLVNGYASGARRLGGRLFTDTPVTGIRTRGGRIEAVLTPAGEIATPIVVNAAGAWAARIGQMVGVDLPIRPYRRQYLVTTPIPEIPPDFPMVIDFARSLYFHREGEGILTGMSNRAEPPGFNEQLDPEWELVHMEAAIARMPLLERAGVRARVVGLYEVTPDAHPILGRVPAVEGFYVVAGFSGHGVMHGPIAGLLMAEEILDGEAHTLDIAPLRWERFALAGRSAEYNVI